MRINLVKRENASELVLSMMIWAIVSMLGMRLWLELTGYWIVGRGNWHIAHMLWGGLIMLIATTLTFGFHGNKTKKFTAGLFGFGFGLFIDEIGKFVTRDNNYFFQPAIILIYLLFIVLFLTYRYFERSEPKDPKSLLFQVISGLEEVADGDLDAVEKEKMIEKLEKIIGMSKGNNLIFAKELRQLVIKIEVSVKSSEDWFSRSWHNLRRFAYRKIFKRRAVLGILMITAIYFIAGGVIDTWYLMSKFAENRLFDFWYRNLEVFTRGETILFGLKSLSDIMASIMFVTGIWWVIKGKKRKGLRYFQYGLLVNIFLASVFKFYFEQFSGVFGLGMSIAVYYGLDRLRQEVI